MWGKDIKKMQLDVVISPTCHINNTYSSSMHAHCTLRETITDSLYQSAMQFSMSWKTKYPKIFIFLNEIEVDSACIDSSHSHRESVCIRQKMKHFYFICLLTKDIFLTYSSNTFRNMNFYPIWIFHLICTLTKNIFLRVLLVFFPRCTYKGFVLW